MSDIEFFAKFNPKPFKSLAKMEQERIDEIKKERLKEVKKPCPEPLVETREPFYD